MSQITDILTLTKKTFYKNIVFYNLASLQGPPAKLVYPHFFI